MNILKLGFAVLTLAIAGSASAKTFDVPNSQGLKLRVLGYNGSTNGTISVEVVNGGKAPSEFNAQGLYFVPEENANDAPQRLGAVGPFRVRSDKQTRSEDRVSVPAAGAVKLELDVYCIDSHRRSPKTGDKFRLAEKRMPRELTQEIHKNADKAAKEVGGFAAPAAKGAVQSEVWNARNKKWLKLEGEGKQEATK